jgi:hypothetical protein
MQSIFKLLFFKRCFIFSAAILLTACGSERDTPFNPSGGSSSSGASLGASIPMTVIYKYLEETPEQPASVETLQKQIAVIRDEDEFEIYWQTYYRNLEPYSIDFENEQVVLLDLGNIGSCTSAVTYRSYKANEYSNDAVLVTFNYHTTNDSTSSQSSSSSSSSDPECTDPVKLAKKRPYYFFKVETRKKILIDESLTFGTL